MWSDRILHVAYAPLPSTSHWKTKTTDWAGVCDWAEHPRTGSKDGPGYVLGELQETVDDHRGKIPGCVALHRNKEAIVSRDVIALDADALTPLTRDAIIDALRNEGWEAVVHSTASSTPEAPKLRILILPDRSLTPDEYRLVVRYLIRSLGPIPAVFDTSCDEPERLMYMPTEPSDGSEYFTARLGGEPLVVDALILDAALDPEEEPVPVAPTSVVEDIRPRPEEFVLGQVAWVLGKLDELAELEVGCRVEGFGDPAGWDVGVLKAAGRLIQAANSGASYTLEKAEADFLAHAPEDDGTYSRQYKWEQALKNDGSRPLPYSFPEDSFDSAADSAIVGAGTNPWGDGEVFSGQLRMAYRLLKRYRGRLLYVHGLGWHYWDGKRWARDTGEGRARRAVKAVLRAGKDTAMTDVKLRQDINKCESSSGVKGTLDLASVLIGFAADVMEMDKDPWLMNCANGTIDVLGDRQVRPHSPEDHITKVALGSYDPGAAPSVWRNFCEQVLPDPSVRSFFQRVIGQSCFGVVREHLFPIMTGVGANGKSTMIGAIVTAFGDYAVVVNPDMFMAGNRGIGGPEMLVLRGARLALASETGKGRVLDDAVMKRLTGGDRLTARDLWQSPVTWIPSHKLVYPTNHPPKINGDDAATARRMALIKFDRVFAEAEQDPKLGETLTLHASAILTWAVEGLFDYLDHGEDLKMPDAVRVPTRDYLKENDALTLFLESRCVMGERLYEKSGDLYVQWTGFQESEGFDRMTQTAFGTELGQRGYQSDLIMGTGRVRRGLRLRTAADDDLS